jgi:hypothetical protein
MARERRTYTAPRLRRIVDPEELRRLDLQLIAELTRELARARKRAALWKRYAKRLWTRAVPDTFGRHFCAARDVKMRRHGR